MLPDRDGSGLVQRKSHHDLEERFPLWPVVQLLVSISNYFFFATPSSIVFSIKKMKESGVLSNIWSKYRLQKAEVSRIMVHLKTKDKFEI